MIQSMTGYGKAVAAFGTLKIHVEVKSLNSKALDLTTRVAAAYRDQELTIRRMAAEALERGKVELAVWQEDGATDDVPVLNAAVVENYCRQIRACCQRTGLPEPADWYGTLLRLPGVLDKAAPAAPDEAEGLAVRGAVAEALQACVAFREQEGRALEAKFAEKIDNIEALAAQLEPYEKGRVERIKARIVEGLRDIPDVDYDKNRLEQELIYYIEKLDISEEKQRLANHLRYFRETMRETGRGVGKKLAFIAQEMGREINTTGSKSNQAEMQNIVVKMKDELEQIKEQVLNAL